MSAPRCLLLPTPLGPMLLPASVVAEVIPAAGNAADAATGAAHGIRWKERTITLAALAADTGDAPPPSWFAIMKALGEDSPLAHYALALVAAPELAPRDWIEGAVEAGTREHGEYVGFRVKVGEDWLIVPDLERLEQRVTGQVSGVGSP